MEVNFPKEAKNRQHQTNDAASIFLKFEPTYPADIGVKA